jgi:hypothetical protein
LDSNTKLTREEAAASANAEDAALWRWFSDLYDQGVIRWCKTDSGWLVSVNHRHVATTATFDEGIREAKARATAIEPGADKNHHKTP